MQILPTDVGFSLDSVITAVDLMMVFTGLISTFVNEHPQSRCWR